MRLRSAIAVAAVAGGVIATYLTWTHFAHTAPVCVTGGCETVQKSKYSELAGVPVALLGLLAYIAIFATAFVRGVMVAFAGALLAIVGVGFSGYLLWAQLGPIDAICQWCIGNDVVISVVAALCVARMLTEPDATT